MEKASTAAIKLTAKHRHALQNVLEQFAGKRFRRGDVATWIHPITRPNCWEKADAIAAALVKESLAAGLIRRSGQGYVGTPLNGKSRPLIGGGVAAEFPKSKKLGLDTACPGKWIAVDLETGDIWEGTPEGWKQASAAQRKRAQVALAKC
ncbi:hypothetical protein [Paucibacter soli]|uniref:hypothetical protein n=1 Tax=Paucibacter soli TaxID=3133433 RepID=UPI0030A2C7EB